MRSLVYVLCVHVSLCMCMGTWHRKNDDDDDDDDAAVLVIYSHTQ